MGFDLDPFDDIFPDSHTKNARAGCKFQPKAKPRSRKESSVSVPSTQSVQTVDMAENELTDLVGSSLASSETHGTQKPLKNNEDSFSGAHSSDDNISSGLANPSLEHIATRESVGPIDGLHSHIVMTDNNGDWDSSFGKLSGENADIFFGLESLDDFLSQSTTATVSTASRSPPKVDMGAELKNGFSSSCPVHTEAEDSLPPSETPTVHVSDTRITEEGLGIPVVSPVDDSTLRVSNAAPAHTCPELSMTQDPLTCGEAVVSSSGGDFNIDNRSLETEFQEAEAFCCLDSLDIMSELTTSSGRRTGKFQPKPKVQVHKEKPSPSIPNPDAVVSVSCPQDAQSVPSETECMDEGSIPAFPPDDVLDFSSLRFDDSVPTDLTSELLVNEEPKNLMETSQSDAAIPGEHPEAVPEMPEKVATHSISTVSQRAKSRKRETPKVSVLSMNNQKASTSGQENEAGRSLRRLRKRINPFELVDESEDETHANGDFPAERSCSSVINEDDNNDDEYQVENEPQNKRAPRKSKRPVAAKEKPVRKRKKVNEVPKKSTKEPPKKFSHSTRRNRRRVDKALLETPEDEIDIQKLRIKDLILLAEYKERISNKEATTSETPLSNHSAGNSFVHYNEDETFASEQGGGSNDEQTNPMVQDSTYFNYHSYMDKAPSARWSKQDTELFYEAVRQFGTDLSMIQQLFPDRTRRQVKLKYKKEERQHPLRLREALTNRSKDHSHFELVIGRLQQLAAQEKQNSNRDDSIGLTGEEEVELTPEINEEVAKSEQIEEGEVEDMEPGLSEVQSPVKAYDSEDDLYRWSQYKSEF